MSSSFPKTAPAPVCAPISSDALGERLSDADYIRERTAPRLTHLDYLQLKDLFAVLQKMAPEFHGDVFDYGCGGAPYQALFAKCRSYIRADVTPSPVVDRVLPESGKTEEPDDRYDWVISTQVLEHVRDPKSYLEECRRILRPGGQLLLTTHGLVREHGCPFDFYRWTPQGLEELARSAGLEILETGKVTAEIRAIVQWAHHLVLFLRAEDRPWLHYPMAIFRKLYQLVLLTPLNWFAELFPEQAVVPGSHPACLYVCVYLRARKR